MATATRQGPSALETQLKQIVRDHPRTQVHPHSPSGPFVRAVMWSAAPGLLGQAYQEADGKGWTVRAFQLDIGQDSLVVEHPASMDAIPAAITRVLDHLT